MSISSWKGRIENLHLKICKSMIVAGLLWLLSLGPQKSEQLFAGRTLFLWKFFKNVLSEMWLTLKKERFYTRIIYALKII